MDDGADGGRRHRVQHHRRCNHPTCHHHAEVQPAMSFFFGDGFDLYAQLSDAANGYWDSVSGSSSLAVGRFSNSRSLGWVWGSTLVKTSGQNDAVHHFVVAFMASSITGSTSSIYIELLDGATVQCAVVFRSDGAILLTLGAPTSTPAPIAGTVFAGAFPVANVWYAFEIEVVINNTTGSFTVRKNGNPNNDLNATGLNTRSSANNYANKIQLGWVQNI